MSLRGLGRKPRDQASTEIATFFFKGPKSLKDYVVGEAHGQGVDQAEFMIDAIQLDRDLAVKLEPDGERLASYAASAGLSLDNDLAEVISRLTKLGLDAAEMKKRGK